MNFKQWFNETMTSTGDIAGFRRPILPILRRDWMPFFGEDPEPMKRKKREYRQPQVDEAVYGKAGEWQLFKTED